MLAKENISRQLEAVISEWQKISRDETKYSRNQQTGEREHLLLSELSKMFTLMKSTIERLGTKEHKISLKEQIQLNGSEEEYELETFCQKLSGILEALKFEYDNNLLSSLTESFHEDIFSDYLDMATEIIEENQDKILSGVIAGVTLEEHLRKLCLKNDIPAINSNKKNKKADLLNSDLSSDKYKIYSKNDQKLVTAWLGIRNSAIHGKNEEYSLEQVQTMILGIREFIARNPA